MKQIKQKRKLPKGVVSTLSVLLALGVSGGAAVFGINGWVMGSVSSRIVSEEQAAALQNVDCIIVLGCQVRSDGSPSHMLEDRLKRGVALYDLGAAPKQ